jgi:simple sugar transport system ATP-binding protein
MMVGRPISLGRPPTVPVKVGKPILVVDQLSCLSGHGTLALREISFTVLSGEIVGIAGVDGNGQRELAECISGLRQSKAGGITINGFPVRGVVRDPCLLGFIPEDRRQSGLVLDFTVAENMVLRTFNRRPYTRWGLLRWETIIDHAWALIHRYKIQAQSPRVPVRHLSGGTQQRVVVARETELEAALLLASQATRGLDIGAVEGVYNLLCNQRNRGGAVLFISTELNDLLAVSDRILVLFKGQIMGEAIAAPESIGPIGEMMMGRKSAEISATIRERA